ncbi:hypothetical protein S1OALGB6SA_1867 [Olavius algarvensis spirochete endosymbiont]|nr:hypothetical protein S1OALGB6SA_1867 [Olavius algarvensis spirochete endosymbiont]
MVSQRFEGLINLMWGPLNNLAWELSDRPEFHRRIKAIMQNGYEVSEESLIMRMEVGDSIGKALKFGN